MQLIDQDQLTAMSAGSPDLLIPIVTDFKASALRSFETLHEALAGRQFPEAKAVLHQIKGASGTIGLAKFQHLCAECERSVLQDTVPPQILELPTLLEESVTAALAFLGQKTDPATAAWPPLAD